MATLKEIWQAVWQRCKRRVVRHYTQVMVGEFEVTAFMDRDGLVMIAAEDVLKLLEFYEAKTGGRK